MLDFKFLMPTEPAWPPDWQSFPKDKAARHLFLQREEAIADKELLRLGALGRLVIREFHKANAQTAINLRSKKGVGASFKSDIGFIEYRKSRLTDRENFFEASTHERYHSVQDCHVPIYLVPQPDASKPQDIALSPRTALLVNMQIERDCTAKTALLFRYLEKGAFFKTACELCAYKKPIEEWLAHEARTNLERQKSKEFYDNYFISYYANALRRFKAEGKPLPLFIRADPIDIIHLGRTLGFYTFGRTVKESRGWYDLNLSPESSAALAKNEQITNTPNDQNTQSFGAYLRSRNLTRSAFLEQEKAARIISLHPG